MNTQNEISSGHRSRAPNFTREEQELFTRVIESYISIIESKKTDYVKQRDKQRAWAKITEIYNANTTQCSRTTDNLISCYRNMKTKMKKQRSEAKMVLKDPTKTEELIIAIEDNGQDWSSVSNKINLPIDVCKIALKGLEQQSYRCDNDHKKKIMGTGGGPSTSDHDPYNRIKKIIEPQIDGLYTLYDGDADLMKQFQHSVPEGERAEPIERDFIKKYALETATNGDNFPSQPEDTETIIIDRDQCNTSQCNEVLHTTPKIEKNRISMLKKRLSSALSVEKTERQPKEKKNINQSFLCLAEEKLQLVKLNKEIAAEELKERILNVKLKEMDFTHKKNLYELERENLKKEMLFKEEMRQKEALLIDLKIKAFNK